MPNNLPAVVLPPHLGVKRVYAAPYSGRGQQTFGLQQTKPDPLNAVVSEMQHRAEDLSYGGTIALQRLIINPLLHFWEDVSARVRAWWQRRSAAITKMHTVKKEQSSFPQQNQEGKSELIIAIIFKQDENIKALIDQGVGLDKADEEGQTPLMHAIIYQKKEIIRLLLLKDVPIASADRSGWTALMYAATKSTDPEIFEILFNHLYQHSTSISFEAAINYKNRVGQTALMFAAMYGHAKAVKLLVDAGANIETVDIKQKKAIDYAENPRIPVEKNTQSEIIKRIQEKLGAFGGMFALFDFQKSEAEITTPSPKIVTTKKSLGPRSYPR